MEALTGISEFNPIGFGFDSASSSDTRNSGNGRGGSARVGEQKRENTDATGLNLSPEEKEKVRELQERDREVRTHEQAHISASGGVSVSGPTYTYQKGPDGQMYAVGGEVQIDTSKEKTPEETISKAQRVRAAANAPAQPSSQDRSVAAQASQMESEARKELNEERTQEGDEAGNSDAFGGALKAEVSGMGAAPTATAQAISQPQAGSPYSGNQNAGDESRSFADESAAQGVGRNSAPAGISSGPGLGLAQALGVAQAYEAGISERNSGYLNGSNTARVPDQRDIQRAHQAYNKAAPITALAPAGSALSRAV